MWWEEQISIVKQISRHRMDAGHLAREGFKKGYIKNRRDYGKEG